MPWWGIVLIGWGIFLAGFMVGVFVVAMFHDGPNN